MSSYQHLQLTRAHIIDGLVAPCPTGQGPIALLTLDAPGRNALSLPMQHSLRAALAQLAEDPNLRLLVLRGANGAFCSGAALDGLQPEGEDSLGASVARKMHQLSNRVIEDLRSFPHPTLAVVEGAAAGAGASLALATDLTLAAETAFLLFPFAPKLGLVPDLGASWILPERLGQARAMGLALLGGRLPAATARDWGLIWNAVPPQQLEAELGQLAQALIEAPPAMAPSLRGLFDQAHASDLTAQMHQEAQTQHLHLDSPAFAEGRDAFLQKRSPQFHRQS